MKQRNISIRKINGEIEEFDVEKLKTSLRRSKASENEIELIVETIMPTLYDGMHTKKIYQKAFSLLKNTTALLLRNIA